MKTTFVANTAWYLYNFRSSTLRSFSDYFYVSCLYPNGGDGEPLRNLGTQTQPFYMDATSTNPFKELKSLLSLIWHVAHQKPNVVFSFNPKTNLYSLIACWLLRIPCVPNVSGAGVASQLQGVIGKVYRALVGFFYKNALHVFFQNSDDYQVFLQAGWVKSSQSEIIPGSGVDLERFSPCKKTTAPITFLMAARLIKTKGVIEFIEAARKVVAESDVACEFILAGVYDTSSRAVPKELLDSLTIEENIHFVGHIEDMPTLLKTVDCVALPSYYPEGVPRSLIEAAASGKIIITTDTPGCRETVIAGQNGFFVPPQSVDGLAAGIHKVLGLRADEMKRMKKASRSMAEKRFDENIVIQRYLNVVEMLKEKGRVSGKAVSKK